MRGSRGGVRLVIEMVTDEVARQPKRTRRPFSVDTTARKPSNFNSNAQPSPLGSSPHRASIGRRPTVVDSTTRAPLQRET
jgi:hypothetical protein